jgi:hypothetical protein
MVRVAIEVKKKVGMMKIRFTGILLFAIALVSTRAYPQVPQPAPVRPVTDDYFGTKVVDNYRYFEDLGNPEVQKWMKAQADYTRATLDALPGRAALLKRIAELEESRLAQVGGLQIVGGRYYTLRTPSGASSAKLYVRDGVNGEDHLLIDPEKLSTGQQAHLTIDGYRPSPDGRYVAYQLAAGGSEESVLHILDVQSGRDLAETADRAYGLAPFWRADSKSFFYRRGQKLEPEMPKTAKYQNGRVYLHRLGRAFDDDPPILGRGVGDPGIALTPPDWIEIVTAPGSHYAIAFVSPGTDPGLRVYAALVDAVQDGKTVWRPVAATYDDQYIGGLYSGGDSDYPVALTGDTLYWLSRKDAPRGRILKLDLAHPRSKPEIVVPQGELPISEVYARSRCDLLACQRCGRQQCFATALRAWRQTGSVASALCGGCRRPSDRSRNRRDGPSCVELAAFECLSRRRRNNWRGLRHWPATGRTLRPSRRSRRRRSQSQELGRYRGAAVDRPPERAEAGRQQSHGDHRLRRLRHELFAALRSGLACLV